MARYDEANAEELARTLGPDVPSDLALRVYTSRLLGADPSLVLHGGGNTSVKSRARTVFGEEVDVVYVKGSGSDLASIGPAGFPACRLEHLVRMCDLPALSDEVMVRELRGQMLDPSSPTPSVEALLHAFLPAKFVDHTHADAVLTLLDRPGGEARVREVFGDDALFLPYVMPGFVLAKAVAELWRREHEARGGRMPHVLVLDKHGIFTWGESARESYERMLDAVAKVEAHLGREGAVVASSPEAGRDDEATAQAEALLPRLRGALTRASGTPWILAFRTTARLRAFSARDDVGTLTARGTVTPDHVIRTKPSPLVLEPRELGGPDGDARLETELASYAARYHAYFERSVAARGVTKTELDPLPRVLWLRGLGCVTLAATRREALATLDIAERSADVIASIAAVAPYEPVTELDLFDVEYWSLEQQKLAVMQRGAPTGGLARKVALVTGAGSGIGLATAEALLDAGAHVAVTDRSDEALASARARLERRGPAVSFEVLDVLDERSVSAAVGRVVTRFGGLDVLVSNAGGAPSGRIDTDRGHEALLASLELNLLSHQRVARAASRVMLAQRAGGCLLFNASKSAFNQGPDFGPYAVPKAALVSLMKQYAVDLAPFGVRANAINADRIRTGIFDGGLLEARAKARGVTVDDYFRANLLGRETTARDCASAFVYLATAEATTGCVVTVDGGNAAAFVR